MRIAVTTPNGHVGTRVVRLLVQSGIRPLLLLRDASRLDPELLERVDTVEGDQGDGDYVVDATRGVDALFWVSPTTPDDDPLDGYARMRDSVVRAVRENGIPRTVFQSSVGAEIRRGAGELDGLGATEVALDDTGASVTHLRCGYFFANLLMDVDGVRSGVLRTAMDLDTRMPWVDPRDIGDVAVALLLSDGWAGRRVQAVHGPEHLTYRRVADILSHSLGIPMRAEQVTDDVVRGQLRGAGMTKAQVEAIVGMTAGLRHFEPENPRDVTTTTPTALGGWAFEHLRPLL